MARILYADDTIDFHAFFSRAASRAGHESVVVDDAAKAWERVEQGEKFDLIISDYNMSEMDGVTFLQNIRQNPETANIPFVLISGNASRSLAERVSQLNAVLIDKSDMTGFDKIITDYLPSKP